MSYCVNCANKNTKTGECNNPNCVFKLYNIDPEYVPSFIKAATEVIAKEVKAAEKKAEKEVVFNPFQRGNGCTLAGYTAKEILSHTR